MPKANRSDAPTAVSSSLSTTDHKRSTPSGAQGSTRTATVLGPELSNDSVEHLAPKWFAELVLETEEDGEYWLDYYTHDNRSLRKWVDVPTTTKTEKQDIVEALKAAEYGDQIGVETESCDLTGAVVGTCTVAENGTEDQTFTDDEYLLHVEWDSELVGRREDSNAVGRATIDADDNDS